MMRYTTTGNATTMRKLYLIASAKLKWAIDENARCEPQPGQSKENKNLVGHFGSAVVLRASTKW